MTANRSGASNDPVADAAVRFAAALAHNRGHVTEAEVLALREAGYTNAQALEIVLHVALNSFTNYVNEAFGTEIDFPVVRARTSA